MPRDPLIYTEDAPLGQLLVAFYPGGEPQWRTVWSFGVSEGRWRFGIVPQFESSCAYDGLEWIWCEQPLNFEWAPGTPKKEKEGGTPALEFAPPNSQRPAEPLDQSRKSHAASASEPHTSSDTSELF